MVNLQVGEFPGRLDNYAVEEGTTISDILNMANLTPGTEQEIKVDGRTVSLDYRIDEDDSLVLLSKRIKGA